MKIPIVITSINNPTEAVKKFSKLIDFSLILVGDNKTPKDWKYKNIQFLSIEEQRKKYPNLSKLVTENHYARKLFGYLEAIKLNPEYIYETDDDNIPDSNFPNFLFKESKITELNTKEISLNIYSFFTKKNIWPRGIPLSYIQKKVNIKKNRIEIFPYIQQGLANLDPDVDAIYRLTNGDFVTFDANKRFAISKGTFSPFNTQNTLFHKKFFPLMYLPSTVSPRATDIWRGYIAQRILWEFDSRLVYLSPSVYQKRNFHNLMKDFNDEIEVYKKTDKIINVISSIKTLKGSVSKMLLSVYKILVINKFFDDQELLRVEVWLSELRKV